MLGGCLVGWRPRVFSGSEGRQIICKQGTDEHSIANGSLTSEKSFQRNYDSQCLTIKRFGSMTLANGVLHQQAVA